MAELQWLDTWAKAQGVSRSYALVVFLRNVRREGKAGLRALQAEAELQAARHGQAELERIYAARTRELEAEKAKNRGLRDYLRGLTQRIRARIPSQYVQRLELRDTDSIKTKDGVLK